MPEEVLLLGYDGPKQIRVITLHLPRDEASATRQILERMVFEKFGDDANVTFIVSTEKDRMSGGIAVVEGGGVFGHFPANRKLLALETEGSRLSQAVLRSMSFLEGNVMYPSDRKGSNLSAQVNPYVPAGRSAAALRQSARKRR